MTWKSFCGIEFRISYECTVSLINECCYWNRKTCFFLLAIFIFFTDFELYRMNRLITPVNRLATGLVPKRVTVQSRTLLSKPKMVKPYVNYSRNIWNIMKLKDSMIQYIFQFKFLKIKSPMVRRSLGVVPIFIPIFLVSADVFSMLLTGEGKFFDYRF